MKESPQIKSRTVFSTQEENWSTLGDQLRMKYPELAQRVTKFQESDQVVGRLVDQVCEMFPYAWADQNKFYEAVMLMIRGHHVAALGVFTELCEEDPESYPAFYLLGYVCGSMGQFKQEVEWYRKAQRLRPDLASIHFDLGCAWWSLGNEARAFESMKRAVQIAGDFTVLDHWLTFASDNLGRYLDIYGNEEKAQAEKARCVSWAYFMMGSSFLEYGLNAAGRSAFKNAARVDPSFADAYYQLGALHIKKLRNSKRSEKYLEQAGTLFVKQNKLGRATLVHQLRIPADQVQDTEGAAEEWMKEGLRLHRLGLYQAAIDAYKIAIRFRPDFLDAYYNMGIAFGSLEDQGLDALDRAIGAFKHSIRLGPDFIHAYIALGAAYLRRGQNEEAVELLETGSRLAPDHPNLLYYLGTAYRMTRDFEAAARVLQRSVEQAPDSVHARFNLGLVLMDAGRYEESVEALRESLRIKPDLADAHLLLGQLYAQNLEDPTQAMMHWRKGEKLFLKLKDLAKAERIREMMDQYVAS